ncbi:hypothetical protein JAAARDRAFT_124261, partial [Jaapia argillacea MUCL 33604]
AKKAAEGGWIFRPFHRRLAGTPPGVAYVGLRWTWTPRIWDPQGARSNPSVRYTSPWLPMWLSWNEDSLSGTPPPDAQSCDITVEARFLQDGTEEVLSQVVHITIAPMSTVDSAYPGSRRPSLVDPTRRVASDSVLPQATTYRRSRRQSLLAQSSPSVAQDAQVVRVLTTAAQLVAQEAQSQVVAARTLHEPGPELQSLAKQQHVLTVTAQALDKDMNHLPDGSSHTSNVLAAAAHQVVFQAARQVAADKSAAAANQISAGIPPSQSTSTEVTVTDVSVVTQTAVAQAVELTGPLSSEVDVLMTANSLLQQQTRKPPPAASGPMDDGLRPHPVGALPLQPFPPAMHNPAVYPAGMQPSMGLPEYLPL